MNPIWLELILKFGADFAYKLWQMFNTSTAPTDDDWKALIALGQKTEQDYVDEAIAKIAAEKALATNPTPVPPT